MKPYDTMGLPNFWDTGNVHNVGYKMESSSVGIVLAAECSSARRASCQSTVTFPYIALRCVAFKPPDWKKSADQIICQRWNGSFFEKDSLCNLGLRYQLGHSSSPCPCPHPGPANFIVFDLFGFHSVSIDYCQCQEEPLPVWRQLLREGWFPATLARPQTVFTFECLETFHELTLQGKTNLYDYYHMLVRRSDNAHLSSKSIVSCIFFWI